MALTINGNGTLSGDVSVTGTHTLTQVPNYKNAPTISADYTITGSYNELSIGPIDIANGVTVSVSNGANWVII